MSQIPSSRFNKKVAQFGALLEGVVFTNRAGTLMEPEAGLNQGLGMLAEVGNHGARVFVIGNGGSAAVAGHIVNDLVNCGRLRACVLHDAALLTCMANDHGYEQAYARMLEVQASPKDLLVAISSSGSSLNIRNAAKVVHRAGGSVFTFSGFSPDNPLRAIGDLNCWVDSNHYGFVEIGHLFLLHHLVDRYKLERLNR